MFYIILLLMLCGIGVYFGNELNDGTMQYCILVVIFYMMIDIINALKEIKDKM